MLSSRTRYQRDRVFSTELGRLKDIRLDSSVGCEAQLDFAIQSFDVFTYFEEGRARLRVCEKLESPP